MPGRLGFGSRSNQYTRGILQRQNADKNNLF